MMTRQTELEKDELIAELESNFALAEQSINDLTATCRKQAAQIADLVENLQYVSSAAPDCYGTLDDHETIEVTMTVKAIKDIRAALEAAEGKQVTK
jgi:uncharacterized coiled-coil protein SlyX